MRKGVFFMCQFHYEMLVNRRVLLDENFCPPCLEEPEIPFAAPKGDLKRKMERRAAMAACELFAAGQRQGIFLYGVSGYRPYARQKELFERNPSSLYVAPPGASEHQTGLALDVSCASVGLELEEVFAHTREGKWLEKHAPLYGFILRYPKNKTEITGYAYEPWHIRYVTKSLALYLTLTGLTLEEYHSYPLTVPSAAP